MRFLTWFLTLFLFTLFTVSYGFERLSLVFSEQSYLINPSFAALNNRSKVTMGGAMQGLDFGNFQIAANTYLKNFHGGLEGYAIVYKEGLMRYTILAGQLSKFFPVTRQWSVSVGFAPEVHNYSIKNDQLILGSVIASTSGTYRNMPTLWGMALSTGISVFSENHTFGFSAQNIFNKITFKNSSLKREIYYNLSYGAYLPIMKFSNPSVAKAIRPHFLGSYSNSSGLSFFYGAFYGNPKFQVGLFLGSTTRNYLWGINPAIIFRPKSVKIIVSAKIIPKLPTNYLIGNELFIQMDY